MPKTAEENVRSFQQQYFAIAETYRVKIRAPHVFLLTPGYVLTIIEANWTVCRWLLYHLGVSLNLTFERQHGAPLFQFLIICFVYGPFNLSSLAIPFQPLWSDWEPSSLLPQNGNKMSFSRASLLSAFRTKSKLHSRAYEGLHYRTPFCYSDLFSLTPLMLQP